MTEPSVCNACFTLNDSGFGTSAVLVSNHADRKWHLDFGVTQQPIRVEVVGEDDSSNSQTRTYAEYKVFAALTRHTERIRSARVELRREERRGNCNSAACAVTLEPSGSVRAHGVGPRAYAAVNQTVQRLGNIMRRRAA